MATTDPSPDELPIERLEQLEAYFHGGAKPASAWKIGVEYEKPVVDADTGHAVAYEGPRGIGALLHRMLEETDHWEGVYEDDALIALKDGKASITLEPGGQLEMSGQQCDSLHCANEELQQHIREILAAGNALGLRFLGLGAVPWTPLSQVPWMPKQRYRIMRRIMQSTGTLGHRMMQQTATVQGNYDYADEADAADKMRLAMAIAPVLVAVSANSPLIDGNETGYLSFRAHVWSDTDPARCGFLPFVFDTEGLFGAYTQWALDVPMYFIEREHRYVEVGGMTFRRYLEEGFDVHRATMDDWKLHLTTLFPEVRLKSYLEVRSADSQPTHLMLATPALMKGLLYDADCRIAAWDELKRLPLRDLPALQEAAAREGLAARAGRHPLRDYAVALIAIAQEGLRRQALRNSQGADETIYLDELAGEAEAGRCPAQRILEQWNGAWHGRYEPMLDYAAYR
jgi:glutamate--cysteine ligase